MINLVRIGPTDFNSDYLEWIFAQYFKLSNYNPTTSYNKDSLFVFSRPNNYSEKFLPELLSEGHKLIIANPWEARPYVLAKDFTEFQNQILVLLGSKSPYQFGWHNVVEIPRWFWFNEHLWYTCDQRISQHIKKYVPTRTNNKLFLMPMQRSKKFRDSIIEKFSNYLNQAIWSYVENWSGSRSLPKYSFSPFEKIRPDRVFEAKWYDETYFSLVVETAVNRLQDISKEIVGLRDEDYPCDLFVTEKTFKPIAFQHPFMIIGMPHTLKFLHDNGFETYENLFDESYDDLLLFEDRLDIVYSNLGNFSKSKYLEPITEQKIKHNYHRFYDRRVVLEHFTQDVIDPILEFFDAD